MASRQYASRTRFLPINSQTALSHAPCKCLLPGTKNSLAARLCNPTNADRATGCWPFIVTLDPSIIT
jgi:hypothetical protein